MNGKKIFGTFLAVVLGILMIVPITFAQTNAGILNGQWFKVTASMKGYLFDYADNDNVLQKGTGSATDYIKFTYDVNTNTYSLLTCAQDDLDPGVWHKTTPISPVIPSPPTLPSPRNSILKDNIYGPVYPQIWDFGGIPIVFYDGYSTYNLYPILYTKITAPNGVLTKATISTLSCGIWAEIQDLGERFNGIGSCSLTGSLIPADQVEKKVPYCCQHTVFRGYPWQREDECEGVIPRTGGECQPMINPLLLSLIDFRRTSDFPGEHGSVLQADVAVVVILK